MIPYVNVQVDKSEVTKPIVTIPVWEVPVLELAAGVAVTLTGDKESVDREPPTADFEFDRLLQKYPIVEGTPFVIQVYGTGSRGIAALEKAIQQAVGGEVPAETQDVELPTPPATGPGSTAALLAELGLVPTPPVAEGATQIEQ